MKNIVFFFLLLCLHASAQQAKPYEMLVNGVKVIVVPSGNEIVQVDMVLKGGVQNYTAEQAGIERLALRALTECGTQKHDKNSFKNTLDDVDAQMYGFAGKDASRVVLNCIKGDFETVWPLYVEAITAPKFDAKEFDRIKAEALTQLRQQESNPDFALQKMAMETVFKGMDYAKMPNGTADAIAKLTPASTKAYYDQTLTRSRIFFVVVGDITKEALQQKMTALIQKIPQGKPFALKRETFVPKENTFLPQEKEVATNYIMGISGAPAANSKEYYPALLASRMFYNKAFLEVRTNNGLSYAPSAGISTGLTPYSMLYVTTKDPDKYIAVARNMVDKIKKDGFPEDDVQNTKNTYTTNFYATNETNGALANLVGNFEVLQGDWKKAFSLKEDLQAVKPADVNQVFNKYIGKFNWVYQGDPKRATQTLFTQPQTPPVPEVKKAF
ncbi:insulinase family protein [Flavisolibacter sp. BT320]|nr:insulinase family protein [Flavisolibacter longurius]